LGITRELGQKRENEKKGAQKKPGPRIKKKGPNSRWTKRCKRNLPPAVEKSRKDEGHQRRENRGGGRGQGVQKVIKGTAGANLNF